MSNNKTQMTEKELDQVSGGPHIRNFNGRTGVIEKRNNPQEACANGTTGQRQAQHIWTAGSTTG
jgi:bacteriocin-like protein